MNDIKVIDLDGKTATVEGWDGERWLRAQLDVSTKYAKYLLDLAKKGMLKVPFKALLELFEARGMRYKMLDYESRTFLGDVGSVLDDDELSVKSLVRRGYDSDGTNITYRDVKLWPREVFDAPHDGDTPDLQRLRGTIKIIAQPAYEAAFGRYLRNAFKMMDANVAFVTLPQRDKKALSEGVDSAGGYFVPADVTAQILARMAATTVVRGRATVQPTTRDRYTQPAYAAHATLGSVYTSGFVGTWSPEAALWTDADPSFEVFECSVKKLRVGAKISRDLATDAGGVEWLVNNGSTNLGVAEDKAFLTGAGSSTEPDGILNAPGLSTTNIAGTSANAISNTTGADGSASKLITLAGTLPSQYQRDALLVMTSTTEAAINKLVDANRNWLFPRVEGSDDGLRDLMGFDVMNSPHLPADGVAGNLPVLLGDMSGYLIAARSLITMRLDERFADVDQLAVILADRVGGAVHNIDAFRAGVV